MSPGNFTLKAPAAQFILAVCAGPETSVQPAVKEAQSRVCLALKTVSAGDHLVRLSGADLLETALSRAIDVITDSPQCKRLPTNTLKANFLALHLEVVIVGWIKERTKIAEDHLALDEVERLIIAAPR
jgi:hypothetical protein